MAKDVKQIKALINDIYLFGDGSFDQFYTSDLVELLQAADNAYYNVTNSLQAILTDEQYDALYQYCSVTDPTNTYFLGVGSEVRGGKVKLPYTMGSLTQVYQGDTQKWVSQHNLEKQPFIITEKLDGISTLIVYGQDGKLQIAYSRGDGIEGADITRHVSKIKSVPKRVDGPMVVRAEIIFTKANWEKVKTKITRSGGASYKNARNCVAGLMNASESDPIAYDYLSVVAYEILSPELSKPKQMLELHDSFDVPKEVDCLGEKLTDEFLTKTLTDMRAATLYEIDGIVIDVAHRDIRAKMNPSKNTLNPEYARKFKIADASNLAVAKVIEVQWNISKNGYLKPRVKIEPTELVGVTVQHATGFNAKFISENNIGPGAMIRITRSGDVIPFIVGVVSPAVTPKPYSIWFVDQLDNIGDWKWSPNHVDAILENANDNETVQLEQMIDFAGKMGFEHIGEGNIKAIFDAGYKTIDEFVTMSANDIGQAIGSQIVGKKIRESMSQILTGGEGIEWYKVAGAHSVFGRGVGVRKMKKLYEAFKGDMTKLSNATLIATVEGFDVKTATKIAAGYKPFIQFLNAVNDKFMYIELRKYEEPKGGDLSGQSFLFTGFRDKGLEKQIEEKGGKNASSVSSKLTYLVAADPNEVSGKLTKARELGTKIITRDQLLEILS